MSYRFVNHDRVSRSDPYLFGLHMIEEGLTEDERESFGRYGIPSWEDFYKRHYGSVPDFRGDVYISIVNPLWNNPLQSVTVSVNEADETPTPEVTRGGYNGILETLMVRYRNKDYSVTLAIENRDFREPGQLQLVLYFSDLNHPVPGAGLRCFDSNDPNIGWAELTAKAIQSRMKNFTKPSIDENISLLQFGVFAWNAVVASRRGYGHVHRSLYSTTGGKFKSTVNLKGKRTVFQHLVECKKKMALPDSVE